MTRIGSHTPCTSSVTMVSDPALTSRRPASARDDLVVQVAFQAVARLGRRQQQRSTQDDRRSIARPCTRQAPGVDLPSDSEEISGAASGNRSHGSFRQGGRRDAQAGQGAAANGACNRVRPPDHQDRHGRGQRRQRPWVRADCQRSSRRPPAPPSTADRQPILVTCVLGLRGRHAR